jgi:hypothetical protein
MDAVTFLTRVVAPGAYYVFAYKPPDAAGLRQKFFKQDKLAEAIDWLRETAKTSDVYHAVASFKTNANRKQSNAENLRCFWYDADIKRDGDGKAVTSTWADIQELVAWLGSVKDRLPIPNLWVSSGYGVHLYWVLDTPIPADEWVTHAKAFRGMLSSLGARGDIGISADSARVLRPPETFNYKVPADPRPCNVIGSRVITQPDFVTKDFLARLTLRVTTLAGPPPSKKINTKSLVAAKSNLSKPPPSDFAIVATKCLQLQKSLEESGEHDERPLWHLLVNLAYFCDDREGAHLIGNRHPKYSEADTDGKFDQTQREHEAKGSFGAPSCQSISDARPGICANCEYRDRVTSPYSLGWSGDLPAGYNQSDEGIKREDGTSLVGGIASNAQLFFLGGDFQLAFDYTFGGRTLPIRINESAVSSTIDKIRNAFGKQGVSLDRKVTVPFSDFIMAWIRELKAACRAVDAPPSFGWVHDEGGGYLGVSVAGTFYRVDGTESLAQPGDLTIHHNYQPKGEIKLWRRATEYVIADKPELHTIVGAAFAAPLMELVGESGILSVWSRLSGARKTSVFRVSTAVWCNPITGMSAIKDTTNSVQQSLGETKIMPVFWDEVHTANKDQVATMVEMFFNITQGRGRARLDQRMEQRTVGYWRTLMILSSNKPNAEIVEQDRSHTNAGAMRLFEYPVEPSGNADPEAVSTVQLVEKNHGHAGREYARWVVANLDTVQQIIKTIRTNLYKDVDIKPEERFHVATIVGIVAGAWIANKIGLVNLDWQGVYKFLKFKLRNIRSAAQTENPSNDEGKSLSMKFDRFIADMVDDLMVTQSFTKAGRPAARGRLDDRIKIVKDPSFKCSRALIHIGLDERELRFDHISFKQWCFRNGQSHTAIYNQMKELWSVTDAVRGVLGNGTQWSSVSQVTYYKIPLTTPELAHYLSLGTPAPAEDSNVVPFPPAAQ